MSENRPQMTVQSAVEVVAAVVDVEQGEKVLRIYREEQAPVDFVCMAHGTARTEMLDLLGIGETAKAIVMCMVSRQTGVRLIKRLGRELEMRYPGRGIAFTIPITGIGLRWHKLLTAADEEQKEVSRMHETEKNNGFDVVAVVMERGYTNVAMDAARKAGARGGTVISARGIAENEVKRFFGIEIQAEKEIVFLVVRSNEKQQVMTALMQAVGMKTRSHGIVLSMPHFGSHRLGGLIMEKWRMENKRLTFAFCSPFFIVLFGGKRREPSRSAQFIPQGSTACSPVTQKRGILPSISNLHLHSDKIV